MADPYLALGGIITLLGVLLLLALSVASLWGLLWLALRGAGITGQALLRWRTVGYPLTLALLWGVCFKSQLNGLDIVAPLAFREGADAWWNATGTLMPALVGGIGGLLLAEWLAVTRRQKAEREPQMRLETEDDTVARLAEGEAPPR